MNKTQNLVKILSDKLIKNRTKKIPKSTKTPTSTKPRKSAKFKPHSHKPKHTLTYLTLISCLTFLTRHTLARIGLRGEEAVSFLEKKTISTSFQRKKYFF